MSLNKCVLLSNIGIGVVISILATILGCLFLCGCGHNIAHVDRGVGLEIKVPIPCSGEDLVSLRLGQIDSTSLILRGNTSFTSESETGGKAGVDSNGVAAGKVDSSGVIKQTIQANTGLQLNEGYLRDVLIDSNLSVETKAAIVQLIIEHQKNKNK